MELLQFYLLNEPNYNIRNLQFYFLGMPFNYLLLAFSKACVVV